MKKLLSLLLASFLVLAACGDKEESKSENKKETKTSDKENKKDDKKSNNQKDSDEEKDKSNEEVASQDKTTEQPVQSQGQVNTQEQQTTQQPIQSQEQTNAVNEQDGFTSGPTEKKPANLNPNEEQNTNMNGDHVVSPGWTQEEQSAAYEEYKKGKQAQAAAGPSAVPGASLMDLDE